MGPIIRHPLLILLACLAINTASATTYYIAANGNDSNNGTSKSTPWLHAPGMTGCSSACASVSAIAGDQFVFRGGDTWHYSASSPVGLPWTWNRSGSSSNPIYIGVDQSWYNGSSWTRPVLTMDNPLTTGSPASCSFDDSSRTAVVISANYVTFDDFEFTGKCWSGAPVAGASYLRSNGTHIRATNNYMHGWSVATTAADDNHYVFLGTGSGNTGNEWAYNIVDGSDSTFGAACTNPSCVASTTTKGATGWAFGVECYNVHHNVIRHVSNGLECQNITIVHDNLLEYLFEPSFGGRHGNVIESLDGSGATLFLYNNITRNTNEGVDWWVAGSALYIFNNVFENSGHVYGNPPTDPNGLMISPGGTTSASLLVNSFVVNNTFDQTISVQASAGNSGTPHWASGSTITWANNHVLNRTTISGGIFNCLSPSVCNVVDNGGEVFQTTSAANGQGYTLANNWRPASAGGATVNAGTAMNSSCFTFSSDNALCDGTSGGSVEQSGNVVLSPAIAVIPREPTWDAGAYQFDSGAPNPPTGLTFQVQ